MNNLIDIEIEDIPGIDYPIRNIPEAEQDLLNRYLEDIRDDEERKISGIINNM